MKNNHHSENCQKHTNSQSGISNLIVGMAIGAAVVYLTNSKDGKKLLETIKEEGAKLLDELSEKTEEVKEEIKVKLEDPLIKEEVSQIGNMIENVPPQIEKLQKKGRHFFFHKQHSPES